MKNAHTSPTRHSLTIFLGIVTILVGLLLYSAPALKLVLQQQSAAPTTLYPIALLAKLPTTGIPGKKRAFLSRMVPAVIEAQNKVLADRQKLLALEELIVANTPLTVDEKEWLTRLGKRMRLPMPDTLDSAWIDRLKMRVDIVPLSLALAQSVEESGWGTSRFAREGNAFYGQWTYDPDGMIPRQQRESKGDHRIARFDSPTDSVLAYMRNLNTHRAYKDFRALRAAQRENNQVLLGPDLLEGLESYSERGHRYVKSIRRIIRYNGLHTLDWIKLPISPEEAASMFDVPIG